MSKKIRTQKVIYPNKSCADGCDICIETFFDKQNAFDSPFPHGDMPFVNIYL